MFRNPFSIEGRIRRTEYGLTILIIYSSYMFASLLIGFTPLGAFIIHILLFWFKLAQGTKRCHDRGNSGWFQFIPFYGLWMLFGDSDYGINKYGPNPKGVGNIVRNTKW